MTTPTVGTVENPFNIDVVSEMGQQGLVIATTDPVTGGITKIWTGTQAQYDAIATKDDSTLYVIVE